MSSAGPFSPGNSTVYTASTTSGTVLIPSGANYQLRVSNAGTVVVFIALGGSTASASTSGIAMLPGVVEVFTISDSQTYLAAASASSTATMYLTRGAGD